MTRAESADMTLLAPHPMPSPAQLDDLVRAADRQAARLTIQVRAARLEAMWRAEARMPMDAGTYDPLGPPPVVTTAAA